MVVLQQRAQEHCRKGVLEEVHLLGLGWYTQEVVISYLVYKRYGEKGCYVEENRGQGVISRRKLEDIRAIRAQDPRRILN